MIHNKIALVIPFYGDLPPYWNFYLESLRGKHLDVLFVTDINVEIPSDIDNIIIVSLTFEELRSRIRNILHPSARIETTRKLCDYKPFYGKLFEEYLKPYSYWAHGDCDVIYGEKFNEFLDEIVVGKYDVATVRKNWMSGAFSAFKNTERMRNLYQNTDNWREVICEKTDTVCFDECVSIRFRELSDGKMSVEDCYKESGDSLTALIWRTRGLKFLHEDIVCENNLAHRVLKVDSGRVFLDKDEVAAFHYIGLKYRRYFAYRKCKCHCIPKVYWIDDTGFYLTRVERALMPIIRNYKKTVALLCSIFDNGIVHWIYRLKRYVKGY